MHFRARPWRQKNRYPGWGRSLPSPAEGRLLWDWTIFRILSPPSSPMVSEHSSSISSPNFPSSFPSSSSPSGDAVRLLCSVHSCGIFLPFLSLLARYGEGKSSTAQRPQRRRRQRRSTGRSSPPHTQRSESDTALTPPPHPKPGSARKCPHQWLRGIVRLWNQLPDRRIHQSCRWKDHLADVKRSINL